MSDFEREYCKEEREERRRADRIDEAALDRWIDEELKALSPTPAQPQCDAVKPGNYYAGQAFKNGTEDDYINKMRELFGGEW